MKISGPQMRELHEALLSAFPTRNDLARMLKFGMNEQLETIANLSNLSETVYDLLQWADAQNRLEDLVHAASESNTGNRLLRAFVSRAEGQTAVVPKDTTIYPSISIGGNVQESVFITGDRNVVNTTEPSLAPSERLRLLRILNSLSESMFNQLILAVDLSLASILPVDARQGDRIYALLQWAQSAEGPGLSRLRALTEELLPTLLESHNSGLDNIGDGETSYGVDIPKTTDFVIVTPLKEERDAVLAQFPGFRKIPPSREDVRVYYSAEIPVTKRGDHNRSYRVVVVPLLGMGRLEAANATGDAIRRWKPRHILVVGIAGGLKSAGVALGDILISNQIADYEIQKLYTDKIDVRWNVHRCAPALLGAAQNLSVNDWLPHITVPRPGQGKPKRHIGTICTGDKVIARDLPSLYKETWSKLIGVEMEAGGVASSAFQAADSPGFFMIRGVSDLADANKDAKEVQKWRAYACSIAATYMLALLRAEPIPTSES